MLRKIFKSFRSQLRLAIARHKRKKSEAIFFGVSGSSAKSSTVGLLAHILAGDNKVFLQFLSNNLSGLIKNLSRLKKKTNFYVAELGISSKGDMKPMVDILRPDAALITMINLEHYSAFKSKEAIAAEKGLLVESVAPDGLVILNVDDAHTIAMRERTDARVVTFGQSDIADYQAFDIKADFPNVLRLKIRWAGGVTEIVTRFIGEQFWLSSVAAFAAAVELGVSAEVARHRISSFVPLINRCGVLPIADGPSFILDTAKAPHESLMLSIDLVRNVPAVRKRYILGNISDYSGNPRQKYRDTYRAAREVFDEVIYIGNHSHRSMASDEDKEQGKFKEFHSVERLADYIKETAVSGEIIMIKGSTNLHLERIALSFRDDVACWENKCGRAANCFQCGMFAVPRHKHNNHFLRRTQKKSFASFRSGYIEDTFDVTA